MNPTDDQALPNHHPVHARAQESAGDSPAEMEREPPSRNDAPHPRQSRIWLIFGDSHGLGQALTYKLEAHGETCIQVFPGATFQHLRSEQWYWLRPMQVQDFRRLLRDIHESNLPAWRGVLYLWGLDTLPPEGTNIGDLGRVQTWNADALAHLRQEMVCSDWPALPRLWLVTRGIHHIVSTPAETDAVQSSLWHMTQAAAHETTIDLDPGGATDNATDNATDDATDDVEQVFAEIWHTRGENHVAFRHGQRYVVSPERDIGNATSE